MYRRTRKASEHRRRQLDAMRRGRDRARMARELEPRAQELPQHRRTVIVIDRDFGDREYRLDLYKTRRVDTYRVEIDGRPWKCCGWSGVLEGLRKAVPRVLGARNF